MDYLQRFRVAPGAKVKLKDVDPAFTDGHESHKAATEEIARYAEKLRALQDLLPALAADLPAGAGHRRQGRCDQSRAGRHESAGLPRGCVQAALAGGVGPRFSLARQSGCTGPRRGRHL